MSFFLFILLLFLLYFVVVPLVKIGTKIYQARKSWRDMYRTMSGAGGFGQQSRQSQNGYGRAHDPQPKRKKKKIDPSVGEYVAFEEISVAESETKSSSDNGKKGFYTEEQQIEDAVWEDIK